MSSITDTRLLASLIMASDPGSGLPSNSDHPVINNNPSDPQRAVIQSVASESEVYDLTNPHESSRLPEVKTGDMASTSYQSGDRHLAFRLPPNAEIIDADSYEISLEYANKIDHDTTIKQEFASQKAPALALRNRGDRPRRKPELTQAHKDRMLTMAHEMARRAHAKLSLNVEHPQSLERIAPLESSSAPLQTMEGSSSTQHDQNNGEQTISDSEARESERFNRLRAEYEQKAAAGQAKYSEYLELMNAQRAEEKRLRALEHGDGLRTLEHTDS